MQREVVESFQSQQWTLGYITLNIIAISRIVSHLHLHHHLRIHCQNHSPKQQHIHFKVNSRSPTETVKPDVTKKERKRHHLCDKYEEMTANQEDPDEETHSLFLLMNTRELPRAAGSLIFAPPTKKGKKRKKEAADSWAPSSDPRACKRRRPATLMMTEQEENVRVW